jgi:hypothetical protein
MIKYTQFLEYFFMSYQSSNLNTNHQAGAQTQKVLATAAVVAGDIFKFLIDFISSMARMVMGK